MRLLSATLALLCLGGLPEAGCKPPSAALSVVEFDGCSDISIDSNGTYLCTVDEKNADVRVRIALPTGGLTHFTTSGSDGMLSLPAGDGQFDLKLHANRLPAHTVWIARTFRRFHLMQQVLQLRLELESPLQELTDAEAARADKQIGKALKIIENARATYLSASSQARILNAYADLLVDVGRLSEACDTFKQALDQAKRSGLIRVAANSARRLAFYTYRRTRDIDAAEQILAAAENAAAIRQVPMERACALYDRGIYAQQRGLLSNASALFRQAVEEANKLQYDELRHAALVALAESEEQQGRIQQAESLTQDLLREMERKPGKWEPCERMRYYGTLGWTRLLAQEAHARAQNDAVSLLERALAVAKIDGCADTSTAANVRINLARAELLTAEQIVESAMKYRVPWARPIRSITAQPALLERLARVRWHMRAAWERQQPTTSLYMDTEEIEARAALIEGRLADAAFGFGKLLGRAEKAQEPDYIWRAFYGQGITYDRLAFAVDARSRGEYLAAARHAFEQAERQLENRAAWVPLQATRKTFLPRFTAGTATFIDFLLRQHDMAAALQTMRRTQVRGLPSRFRADAARFAALSLRPLREGEAMHICHSLPNREFACLMADTTEVRETRFGVDALEAIKNGAMNAHDLSSLLLRPFFDILARAKVVRVIPNSKLRNVEFAVLPGPEPGGHLSSEKRIVVYALDLDLGTRPADSPDTRRRALLLANLSVDSARSNAQWLYDRLSQNGWEVLPFSNLAFERGITLDRKLRCLLHLEDCPEPLLLPVAPQLGTKHAVASAFSQVELAEMITHASYSEASGYQSYLEMPDGTSLDVGDLLALPRVPRWNVLIVCEGGTAGHGDAADDISLAQALLLQGGDAVLAAPRKLETATGASWLRALHGAGLPGAAGTNYMKAPDAEPMQAFRRAQQALREAGMPPEKWGALRMFVQ